MLRRGSTRDFGPDSLLGEMRGADDKQACMFSVVFPEKRVPAEHPLRPIKAMVDAALKELSPVFDARYSDWGRPSISPERLWPPTRASTVGAPSTGGREASQATRSASASERSPLDVYGWLKTVAGFRRTRGKGLRLTQLAGHMAAAAYNLLRMAKRMECAA